MDPGRRMSGKLIGICIMLTALIGGIAIYYLQVYHFYEEVAVEQTKIQLVSVVSEQPEEIIIDEFQGIDAESSPLRFRSCFTTPMNHSILTETYQLASDPEPNVAPGWFDCFDAIQIGADLESGVALAFVGQENIAKGVDRIVAIYDDGRAYAWHQLNNCGQKTYDGTAKGPECPE